MPIDKIEELNEIHLDVLKEIGNIGSGNAATALSCMLNKPIMMDVAAVKILDFNDALETLGGPENPVVGILSKLHCEIEGMMIFIIGKDSVENIVSTLLDMDSVNYNNLTEIELSAISEVGNIMISSYVTAINTLSQLDILITVPAISIDMLGAILSVPVIEMGSVSEKIIFIQDNFISDEKNISANMLLVPTMESLNKIMVRLGIEL